MQTASGFLTRFSRRTTTRPRPGRFGDRVQMLFQFGRGAEEEFAFQAENANAAARQSVS